MKDRIWRRVVLAFESAVVVVATGSGRRAAVVSGAMQESRRDQERELDVFI